MAINAERLAGVIDENLADAVGYSDGDLQELRRKALDRYYNKPRGDEKPGRSAAQSSDVADMVEALVAQMMPAFTGDNVVSFERLGNDDADQAWLETLAVNRVILQENRGFVVLQEALRDALLLRNGWLKAWREVERKTVYQEYQGIDLDAAAQLAGSGEIVSWDHGPAGVNMRIKATIEKEKLRIKAVDPVYMRWSKGADTTDPQKLAFLAEEFYPTRSWLVEMGVPKALAYSLRRADDRRAYEGYSRHEWGSFPQQVDQSTEQVECYWVHIRYDADGDGISELHRILYSPGGVLPADRILADDIVSFIPYASGTPWIQPHRLDGLGVYDKLAEIEAVKTTALRQWLDNLGHCNSSRLAVNVRAVQLADVIDNRPGGVVRVNGSPSQEIAPIVSPDIGQSVALLLQYMDAQRSERSGASLDLQTASAQIAGETAHGVERQYSARELMAALLCRTLVETLVRDLYLIVHRGMREWLQQPVAATMRGEYVETDPSQWPEREHVNIASGLSVGERNRKRMALEMVIVQQEKLAQAGLDGILVTADGYHAALMDWSRVADIDSAERYFQDPRSQAAQQAGQMKQAQAQQQQQIQAHIAQLAAAAAQQQQLIENQMEKYKADQSAALDYFREAMKAELELMKAGQDANAKALQVVAMGRSANENAKTGS